ncbi:MAG: bifunctional methionine sulfoxide reductase B/A protein [Kiritimatiellae bacterium]|nr:bifunctional methionine sulfoxide reductase B/A protein [Kiritimatiellia bacterium]MDD4735431.1 bifunctional methionine sulfoxide reductase B/A protein [Kiritimatiellia bacterium]
MNLRQLTPEEERVIVHKGTERPFSGDYESLNEAGVYTCRRCGAMLYRSEDKFDAGCGWPSFDDELPGAVKRVRDADGQRTEILCANCGGHLGHVFLGERFTSKSTRHCVNSISMLFIPEAEVRMGEAVFAGGCFWGVEHWMQQIPGVLDVASGYTGGQTANPTYAEVCDGNTGHAEAVRVRYDPVRVDFERLARAFFEIHDPTQFNRQGPDTGTQYRSGVFYANAEQREVAERLIAELRDNGFDVVTEVTSLDTFWEAEDYHQNYYRRKGSAPYCHRPMKRFRQEDEP